MTGALEATPTICVQQGQELYIPRFSACCSNGPHSLPHHSHARGARRLIMGSLAQPFKFATIVSLENGWGSKLVKNASPRST